MSIIIALALFPAGARTSESLSSLRNHQRRAKFKTGLVRNVSLKRNKVRKE